MSKVALITGSSRGIGKAIAEQLALDGYAIALNCREQNTSVEALCAKLKAQGVNCGIFCGDIASYEAVEQMANTIKAQLGTVTALVNNAGFAQQKLFTDLTPAEWHRMMAVHLDGAFNTCRIFLPDMIAAHNGAIVNISSMWGQTGGSCEVHYSAAKAGLIGLTKALAKEVGPAGIRVNCVAPGVINTAMLDELNEDTKRALAEETPLMRLGTPWDIAQAVSFLLSDKSAFITGQILAPNGGITI